MSIVFQPAAQPGESELLHLLYFISDCVWIAETDDRGRLIYTHLSSAISDITGIPRENFQTIHDDWLSLVVPEDLSYVQSGYRRLIDGESVSLRKEYRIETSTGVKRVRENIVMEREVLDARRKFYGVITDISEKDDYQETRARLAAIVDSCEDSILSKSLDGTILTWNRGAERMYGYLADEIIGKSMAILIPEVRSGELENILEKIKRGERIEHFSTIREHKDGSLIPVSLSVSPLRDAAGRIVGASAIGRDISVQKKLEQDLEEKNVELARSNAELEQFAAIASHDLQEPLRTASLYCELLRRELGPEASDRCREYFSLILEANRRMRSLIEDLLEHSHTGKLMTIKHVDAGVLVRVAMDNLSREIEETRAVIEVRPLPCISVNYSAVVRLFQELLTNAMKYAGDKPPRIIIDAESINGFWRFSVSDNGIGIDPIESENIFVIFHRLHRREDYPGTGIGLASCRRTVESHGGKIWLEKNPSGGSVFYFTIPKDETLRSAF